MYSLTFIHQFTQTTFFLTTFSSEYCSASKHVRAQVSCVTWRLHLMYKLGYNSRWLPNFICLTNVLKEGEFYTQNQYPGSKLILIPLYFKNRKVNFFTVKLVIHFYFCVCQSRNGSLQNCNLWHKNDGRCIYCKRLMGTQRQNVPNYLRSDTNGYLHALEICLVNLELWPLKTIYLFRCVKGL